MTPVTPEAEPRLTYDADHPEYHGFGDSTAAVIRAALEGSPERGDV